jgi:hypothetical protein
LEKKNPQMADAQRYGMLTAQFVANSVNPQYRPEFQAQQELVISTIKKIAEGGGAQADSAKKVLDKIAQMDTVFEQGLIGQAMIPGGINQNQFEKLKAKQPELAAQLSSLFSDFRDQLSAASGGLTKKGIEEQNKYRDLIKQESAAREQQIRVLKFQSTSFNGQLGAIEKSIGELNKQFIDVQGKDGIVTQLGKFNDALIESADKIKDAANNIQQGNIPQPAANGNVMFKPANPNNIFNNGQVANLPVQFNADGGVIGNIFKPKGTDTVPAMLTPGEYVLRKAAVDSIGVENLERINKSGTLYAADGALVPYGARGKKPTTLNQIEEYESKIGDYGSFYRSLPGINRKPKMLSEIAVDRWKQEEEIKNYEDKLGSYGDFYRSLPGVSRKPSSIKENVRSLLVNTGLSNFYGMSSDSVYDPESFIDVQNTLDSADRALKSLEIEKRFKRDKSKAALENITKPVSEGGQGKKWGNYEEIARANGWSSDPTSNLPNSKNSESKPSEHKNLSVYATIANLTRLKTLDEIYGKISIPQDPVKGPSLLRAEPNTSAYQPRKSPPPLSRVGANVQSAKAALTPADMLLKNDKFKKSQTSVPKSKDGNLENTAMTYGALMFPSVMRMSTIENPDFISLYKNMQKKRTDDWNRGVEKVQNRTAEDYYGDMFNSKGREIDKALEQAELSRMHADYHTHDNPTVEKMAKEKALKEEHKRRIEENIQRAKREAESKKVVTQKPAVVYDKSTSLLNQRMIEAEQSGKPMDYHEMSGFIRKTDPFAERKKLEGQGYQASIAIGKLYRKYAATSVNSYLESLPDPKTKNILPIQVMNMDWEEAAKPNPDYLPSKEKPFVPKSFSTPPTASPLDKAYNYRMDRLKSQKLSRSEYSKQARKIRSVYNEARKKRSGEAAMFFHNEFDFDPEVPLPMDIQNKASGGFVSSDTVPAMLSPGEFVLTKSATDKIGRGNLDKVNRFAKGGFVTSKGPATGGTPSNQFSMPDFSSLLDGISSFSSSFGAQVDKLIAMPKVFEISLSSMGVNVNLNGAELLAKLPDLMRLTILETIQSQIGVITESVKKNLSGGY